MWRLKATVQRGLMAAVVSGGAVLASGHTASGDVILDWNQALLDAVKTTNLNPPRAARAMAMTHLAMFNAVNAVDQTHHSYGGFGLLANPGTSREAAAVEAAYNVLTNLFPTQAGAFTAARGNSLAAIPDGQAKTDGIDLGLAAANHMLALRANDGSDNVVPYVPGSDPGDWQTTPPAHAPALLPQWANVTPFAMTSGSQFRLPGPPALDSAEWATAFNQVKEIGSKTSATRTADQTEIAYFWADGAGTFTPPGHWNHIAQEAAAAHGYDISQNARLFALLGMAVADASISCWDNKYAYNFWRPITAIRNAETDGNDATVDDDAWEPLIVTPPFPEYSSGHSTFSGASAGILTALFGDMPFTTYDEIDALGTIGPRSYNSFLEAAIEAGDSRIYGGIHYMFSNTPAVNAGLDLADYIVASYLTPVPEPATLGLLAVGGWAMLQGRGRRRTSI